MHMAAEVFAPGEYIREELEARGWTQQDLATILDRPLPTLNLIIAGKKAITPDTAKGLAAAFGTSPEYWLNLENAYRLGLTESGDEEQVARRAKIYEIAPVNDMIKRGWIDGSTNVDVLEENLKAFFETDSLDKIGSEKFAARKSTDYSETTPQQRAWFYRARKLAKGIPAKKYSADKLRKGLDTLHSYTLDVENIRKIPAMLADWGIRMVVVEALPKSKIDGAAFWLDDVSPAIAISMRFDRVDAFWFTTIHELIHIHHEDGQLVLDLDIVCDSRGEAGKDVSEVEERTNRETREALISASALSSFITRTRPLYSKVKIQRFAKVQEVHPGIVVGQLQKRGEVPYSHFRDMLVAARQFLFNATIVDGFGQKVGV